MDYLIEGKLLTDIADEIRDCLKISKRKFTDEAIIYFRTNQVSKTNFQLRETIDATGGKADYSLKENIILYGYELDKDGNKVPVLYPSFVYEEGSEVYDAIDYQEKFYYIEPVEIEGVNYDKWGRVNFQGEQDFGYTIPLTELIPNDEGEGINPSVFPDHVKSIGATTLFYDAEEMIDNALAAAY